MGEAKRKAEALSVVTPVLMDWADRGLMITLLRSGQGQGSAYSKGLARTIAALKCDDDFDYLEDGGNLLKPPGTTVIAVSDPDVISLIREKGHELVPMQGGEDGGPRVEVLVRVAGRECPDRVVNMTGETIEFALTHIWEKINLRGAVAEKLAGVLGDLEDAKAGRYVLPTEEDAEADEEEAAEETAAPTNGGAAVAG